MASRCFSTIVVLGLFALALAGDRNGASAGQLFLVDVQPETAVNVVGTEHTVTASLTVEEIPSAAGSDGFTFEITDGPNTGKTGQGSPFTYTGDSGPGTDTILACYLQEFCDTATKTWEDPTPTPTPEPSATPTATPADTSPDVEAPAELPDTGTQPGGGFPWPGAIALALGGVVLLAGGATLARRAR